MAGVMNPRNRPLKHSMVEMTANLLQQYGYHPVVVDSWGTNQAISDQRLADMSVAELSSLAPAESQIFLVTTINVVPQNPDCGL